MKSRILTLLLICFSITVNSQILITSADNDAANPLDCSTFIPGPPNFFDDGGQAGDYAGSINDTIVICPDLVNDDKLIFTTLNGGSINIDATDTLFVYDGPDATSPLLAAINDVTYPAGIDLVSSFANTSGCLTFVFISDGATEGAGWEANIACATPPQPFNLNAEVYVNHDFGNNYVLDDTTLYIDLCFGDTVTFVINRDYPNSEEVTGTGYSQTNDNVTTIWGNSQGTSYPNVDTVEIEINSYDGFILNVQAVDLLLHQETREFYVRVGQVPNFGGLDLLPDTVCINSDVGLYGGFVQASSTYYGFGFPEGNITIGGEVAGQTYLPDGSGVNYETTIDIQGFGVDDSVSASCGIENICLNMEHSYLGDLEATITCPDGSVAILFNSYTGNGLAPGGFGGSNTFLGNPIDNTNQNQPGIGFDYCFADNAMLGTLGTEHGAGNSVATTVNAVGQTMPAGTYLPEENLNSTLEGCPLNGQWTITIRDNISADDGFIFGWSLNLESCNYGDSLSFNNTAVLGEYINVLPIVSQNDSILTTTIQNFGANPYTFQVTDDFGCVHDTVVNVYTFSQVDLNFPGTVCGVDYDASGNVGENGEWTFFNSAGTPTFDDVNDVNTSISVDNYGVYNLIYTDLLCNTADTAVVEFLEIPTFGIVGDFNYCPGADSTFAISDSLLFAEIDWNSGVPEADTNFTIDLGTGTYFVIGTGLNGCSTDTLINVLAQLPIVLQQDTFICEPELIFANNEDGGALNGSWSQLTGPGTAQFATPSDVNSTVNFDVFGTYTLTYSETQCNDADTISVVYSDAPVIEFSPVDFFICPGDFERVELLDSSTLVSSTWGLPNPAEDTLFSANLGVGMYTLSVVNIYGCSNDSIITISSQAPVNLENVSEVCGDSLSLTFGTGPSLTGGTWTTIDGPVGGVPVFTPADALNPAIEINKFGEYTLVYTEPVCQDQDTITVNYIQYAYAVADNQTVCTGESATFTLTTTGIIDNISWSTGSNDLSIVTDVEGQYFFTVENQCNSYVGSVVLESQICEVELPNVFTPDGGSENEEFKVLNVNDGITEFNCQIVNRWGNLVYEWFDINSGWNGQTFRGQDAVEGTYFYTIKAKTVSGTEINKQGFVQLYR